MKIFFATDIHGSEICWRKFLNAAAFYKADMVVLGGDVTGKVLVPILAMPGYWEVSFGGKRLRLETHQELDEIQRKIRDRRSYPAVMAPDELDALNEADGSVDRRFTQEMTRGLDRWLDMADSKLRGGQIPCVLNGGNDDIWEIDDIIEQSPCVSFGEAKVIDIGGFYLASMGWTNPTPWNTFREAPEDVLATKIDAVVSQIPDMERAIFNFHAPPYGTGLDEAPALDETLRPIHGGAVMKPVGSKAVREAGALYAYNTTFAQYTLDATLVIAVTYLFSAIAVVILPLRKPDLWDASPASKVKLFGVPVVPVAGVVTIALLVYNLWEWLSKSAYGVNHKGSLVYMGAMYVLAILIYVGARIVRNRQGIDLSLINKEIPVE